MWRNGSDLAAVRVREPIERRRLCRRLDHDSTRCKSAQAASATRGLVARRSLGLHSPICRAQLTADIERLSASVEQMPMTPDSRDGAWATARVAIAADARRSSPTSCSMPRTVRSSSARGSHVRAFTRLVGPCYIGDDVQVVGGDVDRLFDRRREQSSRRDQQHHLHRPLEQGARRLRRPLVPRPLGQPRRRHGDEQFKEYVWNVVAVDAEPACATRACSSSARYSAIT